jgi:hypothetical protein
MEFEERRPFRILLREDNTVTQVLGVPRQSKGRHSVVV